MNKVLHQETESLGYVIVEPGVTFAQISELLQETPYFADVTASCAKTSLIGNVLDRGVGFSGQRTSDLVGLEVLLANGDIVKLGSFWSSLPHTQPTFHYPAGLGPDPCGLFLQSNFGIVLSAAFRLHPRPAASRLVCATFLQSDLPTAIAGLSAAYRLGLLQGVAKIYSASAVQNYGGASAGESFQVLAYTKSAPDAMPTRCHQLQATLGPSFGSLQLLSRGDIAAGLDNPSLREALDRFEGKPTCDGHRRAFGPDCRLDRLAARGWLFFLPVVPFAVGPMCRAFQLLARQAVAGVTVGATMNILSPHCVDLVVSIHFSRQPDIVAAAHALLDALHHDFAAEGFYSYRYVMAADSNGGGVGLFDSCSGRPNYRVPVCVFHLLEIRRHAAVIPTPSRPYPCH